MMARPELPWKNAMLGAISLWIILSWQGPSLLVQAFLISKNDHSSRSFSSLTRTFMVLNRNRPKQTESEIYHDIETDNHENPLLNEEAPSKEPHTNNLANETKFGFMNDTPSGRQSSPSPNPEPEELPTDFWKLDPSDAFGSMLLQLQQQEQQQEEEDAADDQHPEDEPPTTTTTSSMAAAVLNNIWKQQDTTNKSDSSTNASDDSIAAATTQSTSPASETDSDNADAADEPSLLSSSAPDQELSLPDTTPSSPSTSSDSAAPSSSSTFSVSFDIAKELDNSVNTLSPEEWQRIQDSEWIQQELALGAEYDSSSAALDTTTTTTTTTIPSDDPSTLQRELRLLAVSIASRTESVEQWCEQVSPQIGGIHPLLETIQEGARQAVDPANVDEGLEHACVACRTLRDLCALSPDLAACLTDSVLRYNQRTSNQAPMKTFLQDVCQLLSLAGDTEGTLQHDAPKQWFVIPDKRGRLFRSHRLKRMRKTTTRGNNANAAPLESNSGEAVGSPTTASPMDKDDLYNRKSRRLARYKCQLYILQVLLTMTTASDDAVQVIRACPGLTAAISKCSSYTPQARRRRWWRYLTTTIRTKRNDTTTTAKKKSLLSRRRKPFMEAAVPTNDLQGEIQKTANQVLAAIGCNQWIPKTPGQKGLRILTLDGGGSRGMSSVTAVESLVDYVGPEVCDSFDMICGTSTGGIIAFLVGLRQESSKEAVERYNQLIKKIFVKSALQTPMLLLTTASYDESYFMKVLSDILKDDSMLDSRADPTVPLVFAVTSKMSSTPTHVALFRNYNYASDELPDPFTIDPDVAREELGLPLDQEHADIRNTAYNRVRDENASTGGATREMADGSRYPGSFRVIQRYALRASTAAPTFFKPVMMGGEMYCDGGIVTSNPTAVAIHEARTLFPDIPIELVVSIGTGAFHEQRSAPRIGWDGIIGQIVDSATDGEQIHHILEDILGDTSNLGQRSTHVSGTRYFRFNPVIGYPDEYPIDVTEPEKLMRLRTITQEYMQQPSQVSKLQAISDILKGPKRWGIR